MKKIVTLTNFFILFVSIWYVFSVLRMTVNLSKLIGEDGYLFFLNSEQREAEGYGDIFFMSQQIPTITKGDPFLLITNDGRIYFFLRYLLYPQKVYWVNNISQTEQSNKPWKFIFRPYAPLPNSSEKVTVITDPVSQKRIGIITKI